MSDSTGEVERTHHARRLEARRFAMSSRLAAWAVVPADGHMEQSNTSIINIFLSFVNMRSILGTRALSYNQLVGVCRIDPTLRKASKRNAFRLLLTSRFGSSIFGCNRHRSHRCDENQSGRSRSIVEDALSIDGAFATEINKMHFLELMQQSQKSTL